MSWQTKARAAGAAPRSEPTYRPNRYKGRCWRCNAWVGEGEGIAVPTSETRATGSKAAYPWQVQHIGDCPPRAEPAPVAPLPDVPEGRYAIELDNDDGGPRLRFFKVDRPTEGRWAGNTFVTRQAGPNLFPIRGVESRLVILRRIAEDPASASMRYGRELGHCGICGLPLTNEESRERGIGPVCAAKNGW